MINWKIERVGWLKGLFYTTLLTSLFWGTLAQFDPFGLKTAADLQSESIFMRLIGGPWYQSAAQQEITVVLIDDRYVDQIESFWPISYLDQDLLLSSILDYNPKAVFLDFLYSHKHGSEEEIQQLVDTISQTEKNKASRIPISLPYLVKDTPDINTCNPEEKYSFKDVDELFVRHNFVIPEIKKSEAKKTYVGWTGCGNRYPSFILKEGEHKTPAFALYEDTLDKKTDETFNPDNYLEPMVIRWGSGISRAQDSAPKSTKFPCTKINKDSWWSKIAYGVSQAQSAFGQSLSPTPERGQAERCTYTDTVHATLLLEANPESRIYLQKMIQDRIVLIGTQIEGVQDYVQSPVNGRVPGVYLIAMALDNYLEYGSDYYKQWNDLVVAGLEISLLFVITFCMGLLGQITFVRMEKVVTSSRLYLKIFLISLTIIFLKVLIPVFLSVVIALIMWQCKLAPMDWISVSLLSFIANPIKLADCLRCGGINAPFIIFEKCSIEQGGK